MQVCAVEGHTKYWHMAWLGMPKSESFTFVVITLQLYHFIMTDKSKETKLLIARLSADLGRCWIKLIWANQKIRFVTFATRIYSKGLEEVRPALFGAVRAYAASQCSLKSQTPDLLNLELEAPRESTQWVLNEPFWEIELVCVSHLERCWTVNDAQKGIMLQVRDREKVSEDSPSPHCVVRQRCVSFPWAQHELWNLVGTETVLLPRHI